MNMDQLALAMAGIEPRDLHILLGRVGGAAELLALSGSELRKEGLGTAAAGRLKAADLRERAGAEMEFIEKFGVRPVVFGDPEYPALLAECEDAPYILFIKGDIDLNAGGRWLSVVGTRSNTAYGEAVTNSLIREMSQSAPDGVVVSGLAYGIDSVAHRAALSNGLKTVAVLAHGLKMIYPPTNRDLAARIVAEGGALVTEYFSDEQPLRHQFLQRNRIVAGMSRATLLIETPLSGGSISTASIADSYHREVFAVPGRATDKKSEGTNNLIKNSKASMVTVFSDIEAVMGWESAKRRGPELFAPPLEGYESMIYNMLEGGERSLDEMIERSDLSAAVFSSIIGKLEIMGLVKAVRGRMYIRT